MKEKIKKTIITGFFLIICVACSKNEDEITVYDDDLGGTTWIYYVNADMYKTLTFINNNKVEETSEMYGFDWNQTYLYYYSDKNKKGTIISYDKELGNCDFTIDEKYLTINSRKFTKQ